MVSLGVIDAYGPRTQGPGRPGKAGGRCQGRTGDLEQHRRRFWQGPSHSYQRSPRADIQRCGEFEEFLALVVPAAHEYRNRQWQSRPLPTLLFGPESNQGAAPETRDFTQTGSHLMGQIYVQPFEPPASTLDNPGFAHETTLSAPDFGVLAGFLPCFVGYSGRASLSC